MKIIIAGDFCPHQRVAGLLESGDFSTVLHEVKPIIEQADYSIVNYECPVADGEAFPIIKVGPNLHCSEKGIEAVKWAGFDGVTLANNHFLDYGDAGVKKTLDACKKAGIETVGGGKSLKDASQTLYKQLKGKTLAIINCCEHEFSIATEERAGSNPMNPIQQYYAIHEAREKADYVLVIVHGGHEHFQLPSKRMQDTYRFFVDAGADAVINHHQHCFSGYEMYKGKPIFYGLGNFCFDRKGHVNDSWNEGFMLELHLGQEIEFRLYPYNQCGKKPSVELQEEHLFDNKIAELNKIIADPAKLKKAMEGYYRQCADKMAKNISPLSGRFLQSWNHRGILPSFVTNDWLLRMRNFVLCESYREKLEWLFVNSENRKKII